MDFTVMLFIGGFWAPAGAGRELTVRFDDAFLWRLQERRKAAELAASNAALQRHLAETTSSFREALQLVESLLGGAHNL
jgi:hypothetical protein